jgi:hypothetical protein
MAKKKPKRPLPPEPEVIQDLNVVWVYFTPHKLLYPIPWAVKWVSLAEIKNLQNLLTNGTTKIIFIKKRR